MHEAGSDAVTLDGPTQRLFWVRQARRRRYRTRTQPSGVHAEQNQSYLTRLEQNREYQRLLARLVRLSDGFQRSLTDQQRRTWLIFEDALLDHAWFLHAYSFKAGYELGKATPLPRRSSDGLQNRSVNELREQALLISALARLVERLVEVRR